MQPKTSKKPSAVLVGLLFVSVASVSPLFAGSTSWSYSNYNYGTYVPKKGTFTEEIISDQYTCKTTFAFDSSNVSNIKDYNDGGDNPGTSCDKAKAYVTIDQSALPDSWDLEIDAVSITSTLPNPKYDLEDNNFFGENDESEVVALGTVSAKSYAVRTYWDDNRDGDSRDSGKIQVQFAISKKGIFDYNNCIQSGAVQIGNSYDDDLGDL